jgi:alpha-galactosidase
MEKWISREILMKYKSQSVIASLLAVFVMGFVTVSVAETVNTDPKQQLPVPDSKPAIMDKPVKVFILLGQSNMLGFGKVAPQEKEGTLTHAVKIKNKYQHLVDDQGNWTQRNDVRYIQVMHRRDKMSTLRNEWLTVKGQHIGIELQFGHILGHVLAEPILVLKSCIGNRSLGWDLLPPGRKNFEFEGKIYAGYRESPLSWDKDSIPEPINWYAGKQYDDDIGNAEKILDNIGKYYPDAKSYEVAGFVWWQGHKDQNPAHASRYEQNLVHLIKTLRKDFNAPNAKFVLATIAFGGWDLKGPGLTVANAQLAVSGETGKYPEFKENVRTVEARDFWRDKSVSPSSAGYHYNNNAETYMDVGNSLGWAMVDLLVSKDK